AEPISKEQETTGAGDLYAAAYQFGLALDNDLAAARSLGSFAEAELEGATPDGVLDGILASVPVPR
ncbi:MAG: hypothetical protein K2X97_17680, partial [Mycobacteriaceae bacterium]|nr:hypothetical protein [Mycobacteriaceae bacterium]